MKNYKLNEICTLVTDYVANGSFADLNQNVKYVTKSDGFARLIRLVDFNNNFSEKDCIYVTEKGYEFLQKSKLYGNEIIISNVGINLGTCFLAPKLNENMTLGPNSIMIKTNQLDKYIYYYFCSNIGQSKLKSLTSGSAIPKFNKTDFKKLEITIHELYKQQHIVNILGSIDEKIENNEKKVVKLEIFKQQFFVQYENSSAGCDEAKLSSIIKFIKGKKPSDDKSNLNNYLNIEGITSNNYVQQCANSMVMANKDDILMVMDGASSGTVYTGHTGIVSSTLSKLDILENKYKFLVIEKLIQMNNKIKELNTGSAIPHTNKEFILSLNIHVKNDKELDMFNSKISSIQNKIIDIKKQNVKLNNLKQLYLKKFFN